MSFLVLFRYNVLFLRKHSNTDCFNLCFYMFCLKTFCLSLLLLLSVSLNAQRQNVHSAPQYFTTMFYNCENLFDTIHDAGKDDYEFLPDGTRHWNRHRFMEKLKGVMKVIAAADEERPVDIIGLCEVENDTVLTYLTRNTALARLGYRYIMTDSPDARGVDVALLYSRFMFRPISHESIRYDDADNPTRDVLHVTGVAFTQDTIDVYVVHLPSHLSGYEAEQKGVRIANQIRENIDSVMSIRSCPSVIVMGDFNAEVNDPQIKKALRALPAFTKKKTFAYDRRVLYDLLAFRSECTYKYHDKWSTIDHILVTGNLLDNGSMSDEEFQRLYSKVNSCRLYTNKDNSGVLCLPFLLEKDRKYGGQKPFRTFVGWKYNKGYSDHLPVFARFYIKGGK